VAYHKIPRYLPQLHAKETALRIAVRNIGYCRRVSRKKGFSDDPEVMKERFDFIAETKDWEQSRVQRICFTDEVWAYGGAYTNSYVTCLQDGSNRLLPEYVCHAYSKLPS
jgi:hypothetical protein